MSAVTTNTAVEAALRLGTLIEAHARDAGRQLGEGLRPFLREGETLPDFTLVLRLPLRKTRQAAHRLRESQKELDESRSHEDEARFWRDHTASALREKLVETRRLLTAVCGPQRAAKLLGIGGKTAKASQHALLLSHAEAFLKLLLDPRKLAIPETCCFDPASAAAEIEPLVAAFREARDQLGEIRRTTAARLEARDRARTQLDRTVDAVAGMLGGSLGLIRRTDLVKKLRVP